MRSVSQQGDRFTGDEEVRVPWYRWRAVAGGGDLVSPPWVRSDDVSTEALGLPIDGGRGCARGLVDLHGSGQATPASTC